MDGVVVIKRKSKRKGRRVGVPNEQPGRAGIPSADAPLDVEPEDPPQKKSMGRFCVCHHREEDHARNGGQCYLHWCQCFRFYPTEVK